MRKSMKKLIALTLTCLMLATLFVGCGSKDEGGGSDGDTIKLGWMGSLTGDQAAFGTCESQTVQMLVDDLNALQYPMPLDTQNQDLVFVGRIREDLTDERGLNIWCCGDQVRKGAATNTIQIAELLVK